MDQQSERRIVRVLSNNAVLARLDEHEMVLVGRGIGYGRKDGDVIDPAGIQQQYIEMEPERVQLLSWVSSIGEIAVDDIAHAVELAADSLGGLHPAIHVLLLDHLAFAVQRVRYGETIANPLSPQIREMFPEEFAAASIALHWLNDRLGVKLPDDEASFIALHLNAARTGETVKQPLRRANELADLVDEITTLLGTDDTEVRETILREVVVVTKRLRHGACRINDARHSIRRDLAADHAIAESLVCRILGTSTVPRQAEGETAFLAVQIHGWRKDSEASRRQPSPKSSGRRP